ncbi:MAG TPA: HigA family addiction module antitoxin [Acetobacteraceae bacterium]|nr:HigA family addiction module antitoxin [Acetobacteraceae bacterium]
MADRGRASAEMLLEAGTRPVPPGAFLQRRILQPRHLSEEAAAILIGLDRDTLHALVAQKIPVDQSIAERLAKFANTSSQFWINMQATFDAAQMLTASGTGAARLG